MRRVSVVGNSGSGKSRLARGIAAHLDLRYVELDAIHHLPDWQPIDPAEFVDRVGQIARTDSWVIDGNYDVVTRLGPVWQHADTVVWLDLPRRTVVRQVTFRTLRRVVTREELWNGNREPWSNLYAWDPHANIIRWAWTRSDTYRLRYAAAMADPSFDHLRFVRLGSHAEAARWLAELRP